MFCREASSSLQTLSIANSLSSQFTKPSALINSLSAGHRYKLCPRPDLKGRCTVTSVGESLLVELISAETDPRTPMEKDPVEDYAQRDGHDDQYLQCVFDMPEDFGVVGAIRVVNLESKEIFLKEMKLEVPDGPVTFTFNSWVAPKSDDPTKRTFFSNKSYLPLKTPEPLKQLRKEESEGDHEFKKFERVYDYDVYNDVGNPDEDPELARPVLGGLSHPYPRRCKTGRKPCVIDPSTETRQKDFYVPRDEEFSKVKGDAFTGTAALAALPAALQQFEAFLLDPNMPFPHFKSIENLFEEGIEIPKDTGLFSLIPRIFKAIAAEEENREKEKMGAHTQFKEFAPVNEGHYISPRLQLGIH